MMKKILGAAVLSLSMSLPALAAHCPADAAAIDAYLAKTSVNETLKAEVVALRDKGMELHNSGDHRGSEAALAEAMRKLLTSE